MSEKRFLLDKLEKGNAILSVKITDTVKDVDYFIMTKEFYEDDIDEIVDKLNELSDENGQLKEECDALQKKTEMDKNDFFISEAKRMRLLAFIEDKALRKEYYEWERRIWDEKCP